MTVTVSRVRAAKPATMLDAADDVRATSAALEIVIGVERGQLANLKANWHGAAADAAAAKARQLIDDQEAYRSRLDKLAKALTEGGQQLGAVRTTLLELVDTAMKFGFGVSDDGVVTPQQWLIGQLSQLKEWAAGMTTAIQGLLQTFDVADAAAAAAIDAAATGPKPGPQVTVDGQPIQIPSPDTKPEDVAKWWSSLTPEQRQALIARHPPELGNLNGIGATVRDQVNQQVMNDDLNRVRDVANRNHVSEDDVLKDPARYGLTQTDATRFYNARRTSEGLAHQRGDDPKTPRPVMLWGYQPEADNGQGRAAICIGNPDTATNTTVIVPGTGSSVRDGWLADGHDDAIKMYEQAARADPGRSTAVMMWMGYDAPDAFSDPRIANPTLARQGGDLLAADVNGLSATHLGTSHVTVIGHSYGSTTVADACAGSGMRANDVVLIGSPGTDLAKSAADFHVNGGQVYVGAASTDPVTWLGSPGPAAAQWINSELGYPVGPVAGLGSDPAADGFGATRFRAEVAGQESWAFGDHSRYYDMGSESLRAMTDIASGHSERLATDGLLAAERDKPVISTPDHIDLPFGIDLPVPHVDIPVPGVPAIDDPEADRPGNTVTRDHDYK
ncbi:alpha/beta hydrolase [Mycobacterium sp. 360MFTsu5.1]|uniref:alpha/beta hydrolase n=1 Tax=Mycobacterium sp. 360MFTsu5.1 TaxID=1172186 RepID=UPI00035C24C9|nr:alpha/beta hydrolase [Mycobacterium sp. 360MFTsu5.1]